MRYFPMRRVREEHIFPNGCTRSARSLPDFRGHEITVPHRSWFALAAFAALSASGCRTSRPEVVPSAFSDANIAALVVAANTADILYADLALAKSQDREVLEFATMVKKDHESMNAAAVGLITRLGITAVDNDLSFDLRDDANTKRLGLRDFEDFAFDSAYAANEVAYQSSVVETIDAVLLPNAQNAELKALLVTLRPAIVAHLDAARRLASKKSTR